MQKSLQTGGQAGAISFTATQGVLHNASSMLLRTLSVSASRTSDSFCSLGFFGPLGSLGSPGRLARPSFVRWMQRGRMPAKHGNHQYYKGMLMRSLRTHTYSRLAHRKWHRIHGPS